MSFSPSFVRQLILGKSSFILSHTQFKRVILTGQLALVAFVVCFAYIVFDLSAGVTYSWPYQAVGAAAGLGSFFLNRYRQFTLAKVVLALGVNFTLFVFTSSEPAATGLYAFYIPICLGAIAGFGYEDRWWASLFIGLSLSLCLVSMLTDFHVMPLLDESPAYIKVNQVINVLSSATASILILYFLINVNHRAEATMKASEEQLIKKNQELTKLNAELDRFVYSSSHDLRAPLTSLMGLIHLTELTNDVGELKMYAKLMKDRVKDLDKFIRDISDYSRNARLVVVPEELNVKKTVREVLETLRFYPGSDKIEVEIAIDEALTIKSDPTRLKMILSNLVSNSFKYSDPGKEKPMVKIHSSAIREATVLEVEDNGLGIDPESLPRIFDMFYQAHDKTNGSGLGLYIVKETVEKLGGQIRAESVAGSGSRFQVKLPNPLNGHAKMD